MTAQPFTPWERLELARFGRAPAAPESYRAKVKCPECAGRGTEPATKFAPFSDRVCEMCQGECEIDPELVEP